MGSLRNKLVFGALALFYAACSDRASVPPEFVRLYGDLRVAEREFGEISPDGRIVRVRILEKYGYTAERFDSIAERIQTHSDLWEPFQVAVSKYIDSLAIAADAITPPRPQPTPSKGKK